MSQDEESIKLYQVDCRISPLVQPGRCYVINPNGTMGVMLSRADLVAFFASKEDRQRMIDNPATFIRAINGML